VKVGVVGCGHLGSIHARVWSEIPGAELLGVHDVVEERAAEIAAKLGCATFADPADLAREADALSICVPTPGHCDVALAALAEGCHLLVEKPLASTSAEGEEIVAAARARNLKVMVGHVERFNPAMIAALPYLKKPGFVESTRIAPFVSRGSDVPVVSDLMIHDIDLLCMILDDEPESLDAVGIPVLTPDVDIANVRLRFKGGCVANLTSSRISLKRERKIRFFQSDSYLSVNLMEKQVSRVAKGEGFDAAVMRAMMDPSTLGDLRMEELIDKGGIEVPDAEPLRLELEAFHNALLNDEAMPVSAEDGLRALRVAERILDQVKGHA
jgi:predicted dehydrogenase